MSEEFNFDESADMPSWSDVAFQEMAKMLGNMYKGLRTVGLSERESALVTAVALGEMMRAAPPKGE